ncbi:dipeptide ABC transporter ATP-binding protein [Chitinimonas koreensis]|uniref:dipeptide ABC transporter ATP-binding protein n=1 Tax=Chitinimonas koreensis TaxID=356302 RepID=UPI00041C96DB|nr:dipeptide ABC transporter ATP-binding protein [Chitinimonas koreensis]QNM96432.1 oligopeptide ABC transporter ATP-binding protein OppD [Chitinimonas koreensis]
MLKLDQLRTEIHSSQGIVVAVDGVSLSIEPGETFALVGESGSGKSVTALSISRLLPDNACIAAGDVRLGDVRLADLPEREMRHYRGRRIAMIFQEPATSLNAVLTVGRQLVEAIETHTALRGKEARAKAIDWLRRVGIPEPERRIDTYPFQMSGGQKQRVMIAMALATEPELLIADEPTTALDVTVQKQILDLLLDLQRERGMAMLLITHDLGVVAQVADRVGIMYAGELVELGSKRDFFAHPRHPYAVRLLGALPDVDKRGHLLEAIAGSVPALNQSFTGCRFAPRCYSATARCRAETVPMYPQPTPAGDAAHAVRCFVYAPADPVALVTPPEREPAPRAVPKQSDAPPLLSVRDLRVRFPIRSGLLQRVTGHVDAVHEVSFDLRPGETLALVGESGSGKTTTGKAILQLLRGSAVVDGSAVLHGERDIDLMRAGPRELHVARRQMQIIFQDPFGSLNPRMRVGEILEEGIQSLRPDLDAAARRERIKGLLDQVSLPLVSLTKYPHEFSGGQRQRIAIARALAVDPKLIVCDEPTSALDVSVQAQILNLLKDLQRELGVAYLFITHNIGVVEYLADQIAVMKNGRIVEAGRCSELLGAPSHDYTRTLLAAVPRAKLEDEAEMTAPVSA